MTDEQLLKEYARNHSEVAFKTLVERHVNTVYAAALRQVGNPQAAEEVTQSVFLLLSQKAASLLGKPFLVGWLYRVTHFSAKHARRVEVQRQRLQSKILQMPTEVNSVADSGAAWEEMAPALDAAMNRLRKSDRNAILLRFFQEKSVREVGVALGITEEAAKKRLARALGKLKSHFGKRGIVMPAGLIAAGLSHSSLQAAAPVHLISFISATATGEIAAQSSTLALAKGALTLMLKTKVNTTIGVAVAVLFCCISAALLVTNHGVSSAASAAADEGRLGGPGNALPNWRTLIAVHPAERATIQSVWCFDNMQQISAAAYYWAETHEHIMPNDLLALRENAPEKRWHISPRYLTCPNDPRKTEVMTWERATTANMSYLVVSQNTGFTRDAKESKPFCKCPVHGHVVRSDATVDWGDTTLDKDESCQTVQKMSDEEKRAKQ